MIFIPTGAPRFLRADQVFWKDCSALFGAERGYLETIYPHHRKLFRTQLEVADYPAAEDYGDRLRELAEMDVADAACESVLWAIYRAFDRILRERTDRDEITAADWWEDLVEQAVFLTEDGTFAERDSVFANDNEEYAASFQGSAGIALFKAPPNRLPHVRHFLRAAGIPFLSQAVKQEAVVPSVAEPNGALTAQLRLLTPFLLRYLHHREPDLYDRLKAGGRLGKLEGMLVRTCAHPQARLTIHSPAPEAIAAHYASGYEANRLHQGAGQLDRERSRELLARFLPPAPAAILDVGGGPGDHACWLAERGYTVHLIDITPLHVELARQASVRQPEAPLAGAEVGDARALAWGPGTADAVVLFGPLYHLTDRGDRIQALREAHRVLRAGGVLLAAAISRFASALDGLCRGFLKDPHFAEIVRGDLADGQHRNPTGRPEYFMDTFFHHPDELRAEVAEAGFGVASVYGVEGPGWLLPDFDAWWGNGEYRERLLQLARALEAEPSLAGASAHLLAVASR